MSPLVVLLGLFAIGAYATAPPAFAVTFDNFCVNYTSKVITFTGDVTNLYRTGSPWNQLFSIGHATYPGTTTPLGCTTISATTAVPTTIPVPASAFVDGINSVNDFVFINQTGTQNTYAPLNALGIATDVQVINDTSTHFVEKLRYFFKFDTTAIATACSALGSSVEYGDGVLTDYMVKLPIYAIGRSGAGVVVSAGAVITVSQTVGSDIAITLSPQTTSYNLDTIVTSTYVDTKSCAAGKSRTVILGSLQYTSMAATELTQGPLQTTDFTIEANCYGLSMRSFKRGVCSTAQECLASFALQTSCGASTIPNCTLPIEDTLATVDVQSYACAIASTAIVNCTTPVAVTTKDRVFSSINFQKPILTIEDAHVYQSVSDPLATHVVLGTNGRAAPVGSLVNIATFLRDPEPLEDFVLSINKTTFNLTGYTAFDLVESSFTYAALVANSVISTGVKVGRAVGATSIVECDGTLGCDSFQLNTNTLVALHPHINYVVITMTANVPAAVSSVQPQTSVSFSVDLSAIASSQYTQNMLEIRNTLITLGSVMGAMIATGGIVLGVTVPRMATTSL